MGPVYTDGETNGEIPPSNDLVSTSNSGTNLDERQMPRYAKEEKEGIHSASSQNEEKSPVSNQSKSREDIVECSSNVSGMLSQERDGSTEGMVANCGTLEGGSYEVHPGPSDGTTNADKVIQLLKEEVALSNVWHLNLLLKFHQGEFTENFSHCFRLMP